MLGQLGAEERAAHFLVSAARRTGADRKRPAAIELPMTRQDIADYLGLTIETVSRVISKFKRDGLVALEGRHRVILRRMSDLLELAGEFDDAEPWEGTFRPEPRPGGPTDGSTAIPPDGRPANKKGKGP